MRTLFIFVMITTFSLAIYSCGGGKPKKSEEMKPKAAFTGAKGEVKLITLDPGHFHAALVQKNMYDQISPEAYVYAPDGFDLKELAYQMQTAGFKNIVHNQCFVIRKETGAGVIREYPVFLLTAGK